MVHTLAEADNGTITTLRPGETCQVRLIEHAMAGYKWMVESTPKDVVVLQSSEIERQQLDTIGAAVTRIFNFRANEIGTATIVAKLRRVWDEAIEDQVCLTVKVVD